MDRLSLSAASVDTFSASSAASVDTCPPRPQRPRGSSAAHAQAQDERPQRPRGSSAAPRTGPGRASAASARLKRGPTDRPRTSVRSVREAQARPHGQAQDERPQRPRGSSAAPRTGPGRASAASTRLKRGPRTARSKAHMSRQGALRAPTAPHEGAMTAKSVRETCPRTESMHVNYRSLSLSFFSCLSSSASSRSPLLIPRSSPLASRHPIRITIPRPILPRAFHASPRPIHFHPSCSVPPLLLAHPLLLLHAPPRLALLSWPRPRHGDRFHRVARCSRNRDRIRAAARDLVHACTR